ncbi:MAG: hypothetical protein LV479_06780 [Methylacidiphilales bacterium]|nr:hypothetical protein [Candidatus Methylacidiphilales bacterium]
MIRFYSPILPLRRFGVLIFFAFFAGLLSHGAYAKPAGKPIPPPKIPAQKPPDYFFTVDVDPRYQVVGQGVLSPEAAEGANCYRFIYDSQGRIEQVEYLRAGRPMPDPFFQATRIDFDYKPGIERRWYRDAQGNPDKNLDGVVGEELTLNAAGFPVDVANLDASGGRVRDDSGVVHYARGLDEANRVILARRFGLFGTAISDNNGFFETRTSYDNQGRVMERDNYDSSGNLLNNNDGVAVVRTIYTIDPDSTQSVESYFDSSGLAVEEKSSGVHELLRTLDPRGFLLDESYLDVTGAPTVDNNTGIHERRYTYDDRGNELSEEFIGVDGKPTNRKDLGLARVVFKYDDKNRVIERSFFGDDGAPEILPNMGAAIVRLEYDDHGTVVRQQFFDGLGHPSPHANYGVSAIRIKVNGDTTEVSLRDANDRPAEQPINGYYSFSYNTATDRPLTLTNRYFDRHGHRLNRLRVFVINPHLHALAETPYMQWSARLGAGAAGLGALLACFLALRKSSHIRRRKVYVPSPLERFLGWFAIFAILEGSLRFFLTIYWWWVGYENGRMGPGIYILETIFILFFIYRLFRMRVTMRVLNINREDIHRLIHDFFAKAKLKPEWLEKRGAYLTPPLDVRVRYFQQKFHAYLSFRNRGRQGSDLARALAQFIRNQVGSVQAPPGSRLLTLYYPSVGLSYFLLAGLAFYTLWQLLKGY